VVVDGRPFARLLMPGHKPDWGQGIRAAGSVPRLGEDSTDVRILQERW